MEQRPQLKLKGNTSADPYFSGTEFQSVLVGRENAQAFIRIKVKELRKHLFIQFLLIIVMMKSSENAVSVFDTLSAIQFFERSHVPGFLPTSQISHVNLIEWLITTGFLLNYLTHLFTTNHSHISRIGLVSGLPLVNTLEKGGGVGGGGVEEHECL